MTGRDGILADDQAPTPGSRGCRYVRDNAAAYSLGALAFEEHVHVESHIASCPMCASVVAELTRVVDLLPFESPLASPSPEAKSALLRRFENESSGRARHLPTDATGRTLSVLAAEPAPAEPNPAPVPGNRKKSGIWKRVAGPISTIPLVIAIVIVGGWAFTMRADNISKSKQIALMNPGGAGAVARQLRMTPADKAIGERAGGFIMFTPGSHMITVVLSGVSLAAEYHVIAESTNGDRYQCGQIDVDETGNGAVMISLAHPVENIYMIHVQRAPGTEGTVNDSVTTDDVFHVVLTDQSG